MDTEERFRAQDVFEILFFRKEGGVFGICTGRSPDSILETCGSFLHPDFIISVSGALIVDGEGKVLDSHALSPDTARAILREFDGEAIMVVHAGGNVYAFGETEYLGGPSNFGETEYLGGPSSFGEPDYSGGLSNFGESDYLGGSSGLGESDYMGGSSGFGESDSLGEASDFEKTEYPGSSAGYEKTDYQAGAEIEKTEYLGGSSGFGETEDNQ